MDIKENEKEKKKMNYTAQKAGNSIYTILKLQCFFKLVSVAGSTNCSYPINIDAASHKDSLVEWAAHYTTHVCVKW